MAPSIKVNTNQMKSNMAHFKISTSIWKDMEEEETIKRMERKNDTRTEELEERKERKETRTLHLFQSNTWMHLSLCFRAVYLCRDARSTSSQRIQTNQEDTFLRLYQVSSLLASSLPPLPPPLISPETTLPLRRVYIRVIVFILFLVVHFPFWVLAVHPHK